MFRIEQFDLNFNFNLIENICMSIKFFFWELIPKIINIFFSILHYLLNLFMDLQLRIILLNKVIKSRIQFNIKAQQIIRNRVKS